MTDTIRICVMRDGPCPHGMDCPFVGDGPMGYPCKEGWRERPSFFASECATQECEGYPKVYFERGGVGSHYCYDCYMRIQAIPAGAL